MVALETRSRRHNKGAAVRFEFADDYGSRVYAEWTRDVVRVLFGLRMNLHEDLYELSHTHRIGYADGACSVWPSPPVRAPLWYFLADIMEARRFLEVGCGIGYTAALMADAGGPGCRVDTIENVPAHADIAVDEMSRRGLADRVQVLKGDSRDILPGLTEPYDVVFVDGGAEDTRTELECLTRRGGALIDGDVKATFFEEVEGVLSRLNARAEGRFEDARPAVAEAERGYRAAVDNAYRRRAGGPLGMRDGSAWP